MGGLVTFRKGDCLSGVSENLGSISGQQEDAVAVVAVRAGDIERYEELVGRHADRVYAVAWCRLGDRGMAEEAAQEAFITGFRRLSLLGKAERFGAWITTIARRTAINLGIRQRHEQRRRQRWAEEATAEDAEKAVPFFDEETCSALDLHHTLASLPPIHRECLALYYLEKRSIAQAAEVVGISESAFKVRLHRARNRLRAVLTDRLEAGLGGLRAPGGLTHSVMLALPVASAPLGTMGILVSGLWKSVPFGVSLLVIQMMLFLPALLLVFGLQRLELSNFRDPNGFRRVSYQRMWRQQLILILVVTAVIMGMTVSLPMRAFAGVAGGLSLLWILHWVRRFRVIREGTQVAAAMALALLALPMLAIALGDPPSWVLPLGHGLFFLLFAWILPRQSPRMDHSLFARVASTPLTASPEEREAEPTSILRVSRSDACAFAGVLGKESLVEDWYWEGFNLVLTLPGIASRPGQTLLPGRWMHGSRVCLPPNGWVTASLGVSDAREIARLWPESARDLARLEAKVAALVTQSWRAWRMGDDGRARAWLGSVPETEVFKKPHARSLASRVRVAVLVAAGGMMLFQSYRFATAPQSYQHATALRMQAVPPSDAAIRAFLATTDDVDGPGTGRLTRLRHLLDPSMDPVPPEAWFAPGDRANWMRHWIPEGWPEGEVARTEYALRQPMFLHLVTSGVWATGELPPEARDDDMFRRGLRAMPEATRRSLLMPEEIRVQGEQYRVLVVRDVIVRLRWLRRLGVLQEMDLSPMVEMILAHQMRGHQGPPGRWPVPESAALDGLFVFMIADPIRDTRDALHLLELAGALHTLDHAPVVEGILRMHRGRGLFAPTETIPGFQVSGEAVHTYAAWESLGLLGALDQVPDLERWEFRYPAHADIARGRVRDVYGAWPALRAALFQGVFRGEIQPAGQGVDLP